jgi:type II secretory pathway component PulF
MFTYDAVTDSGRLLRGEMEAVSVDEAVHTLQSMGLVVHTIEAAPPPAPKSALGRSEFRLFNEQLAAIARAGVPLERSLRELAGELTSGRMKKATDEIADDLAKGTPIEEAFARHGDRFPPRYGSIVAAGVRSGRLADMLASLQRHEELVGRTRRAVVGALAYPTIVVVLAAVLFSVILWTLAPGLRQLNDFTGGGDRRGAVLRGMLYAVADNLPAIWLTVGALVLAALATAAILRRSAGGRRLLERLTLALPALGRVWRGTKLANLCSSLATMLSARHALPSALRISAATTGSQRLRDESEAVATGVEQGNNVTDSGRSCRLIPQLMLYSIDVGCHRGSVDDTLRNLADMYADQARTHQARVEALLAPAMILLAGAFVLLLVLAFFSVLISSIPSVQIL